jgi:hypothetical protein
MKASETVDNPQNVDVPSCSELPGGNVDAARKIVRICVTRVILKGILPDGAFPGQWTTLWSTVLFLRKEVASTNDAIEAIE